MLPAILLGALLLSVTCAVLLLGALGAERSVPTDSPLGCGEGQGAMTALREEDKS